MAILVGLIDQEILVATDVCWETNKVGGKPNWLCDESQSSLPLPPCKSCHGPTALVSQMYCPLGGSAYHRCIYVFVCPGKCSKFCQGWQVFRSMKYEESSSGQNFSVNQNQNDETWLLDQDDWGVDEDDWDDGDEEDDGGGGGDVNHFSDKTGNHGADRVSERADETYGNKTEIAAEYGREVSERSMKQSPSPQSFQPEAKTERESSGLETSFSEMQMSDNKERKPDSDSCSVTNDVVMEEDIGLTDSERWNEMAELLNTKHEISARALEPSLQVEGLTLKSYYLDVIEEPLEEVRHSDHVLNLLRDYEKTEGKSVDALLSHSKPAAKGKGGKEGYEKSELRHGDKHFHKFLKRLQRCPQQCVRYDRGSEPLLVSPMDGDVVKPCLLCGGVRVFEFQLLPPLIPWLRAQDSDIKLNIEFGTVMVYTCKSNCWPEPTDPAQSPHRLLEECIVLQLDPDEHLYR